MSEYFIGVDLGTTNAKALLFDPQGRAVRKASREYSILSTQPLYREMDPQTIFEAVIQVLRELSGTVDPGDISFVSFSSMMHSLIAVDANGDPLTNCIIWADGRSAEYAAEFAKNGRGLEIYKRTGTPCHPMSPLYKIMWLKDHESEVFAKTAKFISIKEYVFYRLFGEYVVDDSIASATGLFNIFDLKWDRQVLSLLGIREDQLSRTVPTTYRIGKMKAGYLQKCGLSEKTAYIAGASDGCLANLGSNAIGDGMAAVTIGTSGAVRVCFNHPVIDPHGRVFCYVLAKDKYIVGGPVNNGGFAYSWFRDSLGKAEKDEALSKGLPSYALLNQYIEATPAGSYGLIFLPFLMGERAPYWNSNMKGAFIGITDLHTKADFTRATVEGICYSINSVFQILKNLVGRIDSVYADGGFTKDEECDRILSDILGTDITIHEDTESACLGAVMLGMYANGSVKDLEQFSGMMKNCKVYRPREQNRKIYSFLSDNFQEAAKSLTPVFEHLTNLP